MTQEVAEGPRAVVVAHRLHRHHDRAEQEIGEGEREQEGGGCVLPQTFTFQQGDDRQEISWEEGFEDHRFWMEKTFLPDTPNTQKRTANTEAT